MLLRPSSSFLALASLAGAAILASACSDSTPTSNQPNSCAEYTPPAGFDANTPTVSLKNDVVPIWNASCAFTSCHGATSGANNGMYVGPDTARFVKESVGQPAQQLPSMPFVTAGDPKKSYLMKKLDGDTCVVDKQCVGGSCLDPMPKATAPLTQNQRDTIRRWIAQGAKDN